MTIKNYGVKYSNWAALAVLPAFFSWAAGAEEAPVAVTGVEASALSEVVVTDKKSSGALGATGLDQAGLAAQRAGTSDSARLLQDVPGVSLYGAGGVSSLPAIHGLADDRIRVQVDGMDLMSACPNHMNSPLSYIDPSKVASVTVFAGIVPVSVGGDSIGGTVQVKSAPPEFAEEGALLKKGQVGGFYRSNGKARGGNVAATLASETVHLSYNGATVQSDNYLSGGAFKAAGAGTAGGPWLAANEVGSSAYRSKNQDVGIAVRMDGHLLQLTAALQDVGFEGFPNQRMDMTANTNTQFNLHYAGGYQWGALEARAYNQYTRHGMNMGQDRFAYGSGMPMETEATTTGVSVQGNAVLADDDVLRIGSEYQQYTLNDWWPPVGGMMGGNTYWNIDFGTRDRFDVFGELESQWNPAWLTLLGLRGDLVSMNAGAVQGYNSAALWATDAAAFNARDRQRTDYNWDLAALARYTPGETRTVEMGYARKSRSPNLYQRYTWSTQPMASLMNNFVGDGNSYVGDIGLKPEVANTLSATGGWHDAAQERWGVKAAGYYTLVQDYIDAQRCNFGQCGGNANVTATTGFVNLQYVNQTAQLYGIDLSAKTVLAETGGWGSFSGTGGLNYLRGTNLTTGDNLYNMMPLNMKLALVQRAGMWTNTAEAQLVDAKKNVSAVRNEMQTAGYGLFNLRSSCEWKQVRLDLAVENVFDRHYSPPLGGAYVGQGASMSLNTIPWGVTVPGMGRSFNVALKVNL